MGLTPTPEQETIIEAAAKTSDSLLISALAGAAKTSTLVMAAHKLPLIPSISVAFNKKIAVEMGQRLPGHIQASTLNSLGHRVWMKTTGKGMKVETDKLYTLVKEEQDAARPDDRRAIGEAFASILRAARRAKSIGYIPDQYRELGTPLTDTETFLDSVGDELDVEPDDFIMGVVDRVLAKSIALAYQGTIDFDDQIYMSTLFGGQYPKFPIVMVDEAQDLSPLNHVTLEKLFGGRLIAVGDPNQSIYAFRGADTNSMSYLKDKFNMKELPLSVSFRCPRAVVERAQRRVPHMRYPDWAIQGKVEHLNEWDETTIPDGAAIICRNNAPLFSCALQLIRRGRSVKLMGADIGPALIKLLKKLGPTDMKQEAVFDAVDRWRETELRKARESRRAGIIDRAECLRVFAEYGDTLGAAIAWAENLFNSTGTIFLMTGHKAKGLEFDIVFHLDPFRIPSKWARMAAENGDTAKLEQEYNLKYVIETRAKQEMYLVNLEQFA